MKKLLISTLSASFLFAGAALAHEDHDSMHGQHMNMKMASTQKTGAQSTTFQTTGTVEKIDPAKGAATISHQAIPALKWPAMTMPFSVDDKALFGKLKAGEKVDFEFKLEGVKATIVSVK